MSHYLEEQGGHVFWVVFACVPLITYICTCHSMIILFHYPEYPSSSMRKRAEERKTEEEKERKEGKEEEEEGGKKD